MSNIINQNSSNVIRFTNHINIAYDYPLNSRKGFNVIRLLMQLTGFSFNRVLIDIIKVRDDSVKRAIDILNTVEDENRNIIKELIHIGYKYPN
uniref:Uncharacterized protein n=1 Tax=Geladintestivirus 4 TaxID=3233136 RepID=A0AAU8MG47_9CAUD